MTETAADSYSRPAVANPRITPDRSPYRFEWYKVGLILTILTLIAGALRFTALDKPSIWGDESATAGRVVGTYQELVNQLAEGSFTPMHYEVMWWMAQGFPLWGEMSGQNGKEFVPSHRIVSGGITLTPFYLRLIPAICGTLMVPAVYFLSRQLFGTRVSLVAATLTCFSAYLLIYSRDAKMYMPFWLFCTLNIACLLWWLRVRSFTAWLCWVAAGMAMMGYHALGYMIVVVNVLICLTAPRQHWRRFWQLFLIVIWPILLGVMGLYEMLRKRYSLMVWWRFDDVLKYPIRMWPSFRFPTLLLAATGIFLICMGTMHYFGTFNDRMDRVMRDDGEFDTDVNGTGWVEPYNQGRKLDSLTLYTTSAFLTGWEWPRNAVDHGVDDQKSVNPRTLKLLKVSVVALLVILAIGLIPWRKTFSPAKARLERISQDRTVDSRFLRQRSLWIGAWIIVPAFALYTQSVDQPAFVLDAVSHLAIKDPANIDWPRLPRAAKDESKIAFYLSTIHISPFYDAMKSSLVKFRQQFDSTQSLNKTPLIITGIVVILMIGIVIWRRRTMGRNALNLFFTISIIVFLCGLLTFSPRFTDKSVWMPRYIGVVLPAVFIACAALFVRLPSRWFAFAAIGLFIIINTGQYVARVFTPSEPPTAQIARDILASHAPADTTVRTFVQFRHRGAEPGMGTYPTSPSSYYAWLGAQKPGVPAVTIRFGQYESAAQLRIFQQVDPIAIERNVERSKQIQTVIVWTSLDWDRVDNTDPIQDQLRGLFHKVSDATTPVYDHWRWKRVYNVRRREYIRIADSRPPPEPPSTSPANPSNTPPNK